MNERGISVDHSSINRWAVHYSPTLAKAFQHKKRRTGHRWRMDEAYIKVKGPWKYYCRAVDSKATQLTFC
jgi:putative transposase